MGIDFRSQDALVAEHLLDSAQVGAILHQMRCKGVAERMRRDILTDAYGFGLPLDQIENRDAAQPPPTAVDENIVLRLPHYGPRAPYIEPYPKVLYGRSTDRHQSLLATLSRHFDKLLRKEKIGNAKPGGLADPQAAGIEHLENRPVALPFGFGEIYTVEHGEDLLDCKDRRQAGIDLRRFQAVARIVCKASFRIEEVIHRLDRADKARL